ncbi:MAG TPA: AIPR family protein [Thermoanaerobaculia bacterium]|nr:AIPR family protein [Thermoanaerobaculia bacterium]
MSIVHVRHIKTALESRFRSSVDLTDCATMRQDQVQMMFLSRSLAAFSLAHLCEVDDETAAGYVTDGFDDNGIDAIYFDHDDLTLYVIQAKWDSDGTGFPELGSVQALTKGFDDLLHTNWGRFNSKLTRHQTMITSALDDPNVSLRLVLSHTGMQPVSAHAKQLFDDLTDRINDTTNVLTITVLGQAQLHAAVAGSAEGTPINVEVMLYEWGRIQEPYLAYYGQIEAKDVADWWTAHGNNLFGKNIRKLIPKSDVNEVIAQSLLKQPDRFWYLNNGITALCSKVTKKPIGGSDRMSGGFVCEGLSVVNGAQTVGSIGTAARHNPNSVAKARVAVRFISLENCPPDFAASVTRATNTQNRIELRDYAALDPVQDRLRKEMLLDSGKEYALKTGDPEPAPENGCSITEATVALACSQNDVAVAVQAKREISRLWEDIHKPPYKLLFNSGLTGLRLWRTVEILRSIDGELRAIQSKSLGHERNVVVHLNRLIAHLVFAGLPMSQIEDLHLDMDLIKTRAKKLTDEVTTKVSEKVGELFPNAYLGSLFKNLSKCRLICAGVVEDNEQFRASTP